MTGGVLGMEVNADVAQRAAVHAGRLPWTPSPIAGVERRMLDRIGAEVARASTIVRYAPGPYFSARTHDGSEEFLVLEGVFSANTATFRQGHTSGARRPRATRPTRRRGVPFSSSFGSSTRT